MQIPARESSTRLDESVKLLRQKPFRYPRRSRGVPTLTAEASSYSLPDAFGAFRVLHQIGAGRLGPVFRAYQPERDRLVAVKMFRLDLLPEQVYALAGELQQLVDRHLAHPHIVAPLAAGVQGTSVYLVQEFCGGDSLDVVMRQPARLDGAASRELIAALAAAIDVVSAQGVHHGALHPRDVLLSDGAVRLTGFGVTEALERVGVRVLGRHPYGAPERTTGQRWGAPADVFALAVMAYELLAGRRVSGIGEQGLDQLAAAQNADRPALRHVFTTALAAEPDARYQTARGFAAALEAALSTVGQPADGSPKSVPLPLDEPARPAAPADAGPAVPVAVPGPERRAAKARRTPLRAVVIPPVASEEEEEESRTQPVDRSTGGADERGAEAEAAPDLDLAPAGAVPSDVGEWPLSTDPVSGAGPGDAGAIPVERADLAGTEEERPAAESRADEAAGPPVAPGEFDIGAATPAVMPGLEFDLPVEVEPADATGAVESPASRVPERSRPAPRMPFEASPSVTVPGSEGLNRARTAVWPLALALGVGVLVGFAAGYGVGRGGTTTTAAQVTAAPVAGAARPAAPAAVASAPASAPAPAAAEVVAPPPAPTGRLAIRSVPPGAQVILDGRGRGVTPLVLDGLGLRVHRVQLERPGFVTEARRLALSASRADRTLAVRLRPEPPPVAGRVTFASRPSGAAVFLDGRRVGVTPLEMPDVRSGTHQIRLALPGYQAWVTSIEVAGGEASRVTASLEQGSGR
ncbi:MAG TPA: PEGA domain-containing protein [Vicinamibacterales bacterium]|nr:PEGA domain-containing protein [Vicinamibacterales bacterium]